MDKVPIRLGRLRTSVREAAPAPVNIRLQYTEDGGSGLLRAASTGRVCRVCTTHESRYTCPRCNLPYCSVDCYRSHGETCTEQFYQEHIVNEMAFSERATASVDPKAQRQRATEELLTRVKQFHDETSRAFDDDADGSDATDLGSEQVDISAERLAQLAVLDDAELSLDCLTADERKRFLADVAGGRMSKYVMPWDPWWHTGMATYENETVARRRKLIVEVVGDGSGGSAVQVVDSDGDEEEDAAADPSGDEAAAIRASRFPVAILTREMERGMPPSMQALVRGAVSPSLKFHLVEIAFAYAFTMRMFNGDWRQDAEDAALSVLHCCDVLREDARFSTLEEVVVKCLEQRDVDGSLQPATNRLVLADAAEIAVHGVFVLDALTDLMAMVTEAVDAITRTRIGCSTSKRGSKQDRAALKTLQATEKKLAFYRAWRFHGKPHDMVEVAQSVHDKLRTFQDRAAP